MTPSAIIQLRIEKDRLAIEVGDQCGINLAAIDGLQNCDHGFRRLKTTYVDMDGVGRSPFPGFLLRSSAAHTVAPARCP